MPPQQHPRVYLRVGPSGSAEFIEHIAEISNLELHMKKNMTPRKYCRGPGGQRFCEKIQKSHKQVMVAFDNFTPAHMCSPSPIVYSFHWDNIRAENLHTVVFSLNDKGMKSCGEIDSDDVLRHAFPNGAAQAHIWMLYRQIAEIHHMLSDGTVRVLATERSSRVRSFSRKLNALSERRRVCVVICKFNKKTFTWHARSEATA